MSKKIRVYSKDCSCDSGHVFYGSGCRIECDCVKLIKEKKFKKKKHGRV